MAIKIYKSKTNNVFADIGVKNPLAAQLRSQAMLMITRIIMKRGLSQSQVARKLHLTQPQVSCLINGKLSKFSLEHLFEILNYLHYDVIITVGDAKPKLRG